jgi:hypothetical protein
MKCSEFNHANYKFAVLVNIYKRLLPVTNYKHYKEDS